MTIQELLQHEQCGLSALPHCKELYALFYDEQNTLAYHGKNYDSKNMMHTLRLLQVAEEILRDGALNVKRPNREELLSVKRGENDYDELLAEADRLMQSIQQYASSSPLQDKPDMDKVENVLVEIREELYR